ncbi:hypothetical protein HDU87_008693 [Geranomyces variabilis]|uniref:Uncharacterized protein n=1 Tax=Geranomyces variabilis TaxID=109894 RepID=A0AAD5TEB2_9FUNG|nr:hypothetical protein HDU87_008693 [Geranomyces variabilis]
MTSPLGATLYPLTGHPTGSPAPVAIRFSHLPTISGTRVAFLDPADIAPLGITTYGQQQTLDPVQLFDLLVPVDLEIADRECLARLRRELRSSVDCQTQLYENRPKQPSLGSPAIQWEQAIVEGHATHPMHRSRTPLDDDTHAAIAKSSEGLLQPTITFVSVPRSKVSIFGSYDELLASYLPNSDPDRVVVPVHQAQLPQVLRRFRIAQHVPSTRRALAQASMRTVCPDPASDLPGYHLKLPLAMFTTSALRTISPHSVRNGPIVSELALRVVKDPTLLHVVREVASIGASMGEGTDEHDAKHLACVVRTDPEVELPGEKIIIAAALVERGANGTPLVIDAFGLRTRKARIDFLETYTRLAVDAFLPPMLDHGFGFECHGQNTLLRVAESGQPLGFAIRDFGGVQIHVPTLASSLSLPGDSPLLAFHENSSIIVSSLDKVYVNVFHCLVQNQLHRLVRALDLHHCGTGWTIVRKHVSRWLTSGRAEEIWFNEAVDLKAFVRMKMGALYRDYLYSMVPNVLLYAGEVHQGDGEPEAAR